MAILMMLILPIHEHGTCFHLFVSSLIYFFSVVKFSEYRSFTSLVRFIPKYFIFLVAISNGIVFFWFLTNSILNPCLLHCFSPFYFILLLELFPVLSYWDLLLCFLNSAAFLCLFLGFDLLCLGRVALYNWCCVWPGGAVSLFTWAGCSECPCMGHVCPPVTAEPQLLLACQWVGLTLRLTGCEDCLWLQQTAVVQEGARVTLVRLWCQTCLPLRWLGSSLVCSEAGHQVHLFWSLLGGATVLTKASFHLCPMGKWWELRSDLWLVATGLETLGRDHGVNWGWLLLILCLWLLIGTYLQSQHWL